MELKTVYELARSLMNKHGLAQWKFKFDMAKTRAGQCNYTRQTITLSAYFAKLNEVDQVTDTILHEIAHALAPRGAHHGPAWKTIAQRIGAKPIRCCDDTTELPQGKYVGECKKCGHKVYFHRRVRRTYYHRACGIQEGTYIVRPNNVGDQFGAIFMGKGA